MLTNEPDRDDVSITQFEAKIEIYDDASFPYIKFSRIDPHQPITGVRYCASSRIVMGVT